jgi:thymidylate synthase
MQQYLDLLQHILDNGTEKRTEQALELGVVLAIKCVLICKKVFQW